MHWLLVLQYVQNRNYHLNKGEVDADGVLLASIETFIVICVHVSYHRQTKASVFIPPLMHNIFIPLLIQKCICSASMTISDAWVSRPTVCEE